MKKIHLPKELCEYSIELPKELCEYALQIIENIKKESEINKTSWKNLTLNKKTLMQLFKNEHPNFDFNQNVQICYGDKTDKVFLKYNYE